MTERAIGPIVDQLHSHAVDRCGPAGEVRASRHADGAGAARLHALEPGHALRSAGSDLAEPRSVRALQRSCLDAAVVGAPSHRHPRGECRIRTARATRGFARRHPSLPPTRQQGPGSPRVPLGVGGRDHDRTARAGRRHQRRHGHRRDVARQPLQSAGLRDLRLQHLRGLRRRLHDGRRRHRKRRRWPAISAWTTSAGSTTTTTSRSKATRASPSPRTSRPGSWATAGTFCASATPTTSTGSSRPLDIFRKTKGRPTFIILDSHIGYGSPHKQDTAAAHGEPLGEEEIRLTKRDYGWPEDAKFLVPDAVREHFAAGIGARGAQAHARWTELFTAYRSKYPELATEIDLMQRRELPAGWDRGLPVFPADPKGIAGRDASGKVLNVLAQNIPWLLGGSADLGSVQQDHPDVRGGRRLRARHPWRQEPAFRHPRARDGGRGQRALAVKTAGLRRHVLHLQRLCAAGDPAVGPDGAAHDLRVHPRCHGRRRGRPDPSAGGAARLLPRHARAWWCCGPATPTRSSRPTAISCSCATSRPCWRCRANRCRHWTAASTRRRPGSRAAPMCSATPRAASPK